MENKNPGRNRNYSRFNSWRVLFFLLLSLLPSYFLMTYISNSLSIKDVTTTVAIFTALLIALTAFFITTFKGLSAIKNILVEMQRCRGIRKTLEQNEERLILALEGANDGLWDYNIVTKEVYHSPRYMTMLGYKPDEMPSSKAFETLLHPDDKEGVFKRLDMHMKSQTENYQMEFRLLAKDGSWKWILGRGKICERDSSGRALRMVGTHTDITEMKKTEQKLIELERTNSAMAMAITANHEINQPLSVLKMSIELISMSFGDCELNDKQKRTIERMGESLDKIEEILTKYRESSAVKLEQYVNETQMVVLKDKNETY